MTDESYSAGDVFWAPDPYNERPAPRPWLVLVAENIPYGGEEYICAALTTSDLEENWEIGDSDWITGNNPERTSFCSPWVLATVKHDAVAAPQGQVTEAFTGAIIEKSIEYLTGDLGPASS